MEGYQNYSGTASWIELSASAIRNNFKVLKKISNRKFSIGLVLKGNAYGHGISNIFPIVHPLTDCVYVISPQDAFLMRGIESELTLSPIRIVVIGSLTCEEIVECAKQNIEMVIADASWSEVIEVLRGKKISAAVHVHIDSGLSREGFDSKTIVADTQFLKDARDVISIKGVMSHFANTEDVTEQGYAHSQLLAFNTAVAAFQESLSLEDSLEEHVCASAATFVLPEARCNRVRVGISLYGYWPSPETRISAKMVLKELPELIPVLSWKCKSQTVKWVRQGSYIGYGCTYRCERDSWIAVFPVGYYDGYPRIVSGRAYVLVRGKRCPVVGRVMMNHIIVDVSCAVSDNRPVEAILLGNDGDEILSAETMAKWAETIQYEIVTRIGQHLMRKTVD